MLALVFLICTLPFLVYGQTPDDCKEMYQQCYEDSIQRMMNRYRGGWKNQGFNPDRIMSTTPRPNQLSESRDRPTQSPAKRPSRPADGGNELNDCLAAHNKFRAAHGVPALKAPSADLQAYADKRGLELATTDKFSHPANSPYGENLFMGYGKDYTCADAVKAWYDEIKDYDFNNPRFSSATGHFTAVVWKDTTQVACAVTKSKKNGYSYVVVSIYSFFLSFFHSLLLLKFLHSLLPLQCNYNPFPNVMGRFKENVLPKIA